MATGKPKKPQGGGLRSSYDLAVERLGGKRGEGPRLSPRQVDRIAEIDRDYTARIAEREVMLASKLAAAGGDPEAMAALKEEHNREVARLREKMETEKDKVRNERTGA